MTKLTGALVVIVGLSLTTPAAWGDAQRIAQAQAPAPAPAPQTMPGKGELTAVEVRGTISAIDKEARTVTLKGPKGRTLTLDVRDPSKFDVIKVGDPVVATYVEAVVVQAKKSGSAAPGVSVQESRVSSKPGENPAGAIGREVTMTTTITGINRKAQTVTLKGPQGNQETIKVKDPKNIEGIKVGDLVEITYTQALAVSLDRPAKASGKAPAK